MINPKNYFYFDIETTGKHPDYATFKLKDERGAGLFKYKQEKQQKTGHADWQSTTESYEKFCTLYSEYGQIVCISTAYIKKDGTIGMQSIKIDNVKINNEEELIKESVKYFKKAQELGLILCGFNIKGFDMPWLFKKMCEYGVEVPENLNVWNKKPWEITALDLMEIWRGRGFEPTTFDEMAYALGVPSPKDGDVKSSNIQKWWWQRQGEDTTEVSKYCERDVITLIECLKKIANLI